mmetsp:Transcript_29371/g.74479  ORF Transcript_29371/g.74479 Transcript_29371/m.74479 type:complete len:229 (-) Transcript_29371:244-930(-)
MAGLARACDAYLEACLLNPVLDPLRLQDGGDPHQRLQRRRVRVEAGAPMEALGLPRAQGREVEPTTHRDQLEGIQPLRRRPICLALLRRLLRCHRLFPLLLRLHRRPLLLILLLLLLLLAVEKVVLGERLVVVDIKVELVRRAALVPSLGGELVDQNHHVDGLADVDVLELDLRQSLELLHPLAHAIPDAAAARLKPPHRGDLVLAVTEDGHLHPSVPKIGRHVDVHD